MLAGCERQPYFNVKSTNRRSKENAQAECHVDSLQASNVIVLLFPAAPAREHGMCRIAMQMQLAPSALGFGFASFSAAGFALAVEDAAGPAAGAGAGAGAAGVTSGAGANFAGAGCADADGEA